MTNPKVPRFFYMDIVSIDIALENCDLGDGKPVAVYPYPHKDRLPRLIGFIEHSVYEKQSAALKIAVEALEKIEDPRKRDHKEPDEYTELGCVMHMATEALSKIKETLGEK